MIDATYDKLEEELFLYAFEEKWPEMDMCLRNIDVQDLGDEELITVLIYCKDGRSKLPYYREFFEKVHRHFLLADLADASELVSGFEPLDGENNELSIWRCLRGLRNDL